MYRFALHLGGIMPLFRHCLAQLELALFLPRSSRVPVDTCGTPSARRGRRELFFLCHLPPRTESNRRNRRFFFLSVLRRRHCFVLLVGRYDTIRRVYADRVGSLTSPSRHRRARAHLFVARGGETGVQFPHQYISS